MYKTQESYKLTLLIILILVKFFDIVYIPNHIISYFAFFIVLYFTIKNCKRPTLFEKIILVSEAFVLLSFFYSLIFNKQPIKPLIVGTYTYLGLLSFFVLKNYKFNISNTVYLLKTITIIMTLLYIIQWFLYPTILFRAVLNEFDVNELQFRMRFTCSICSYLALFYGLNRLLISQRSNGIIYIILGAIPIIIMGFRSLIILSILALIIMIFFVSKELKSYFKYITFFCILFFVALQTPLVQEKINEMQSRQEQQQTFTNEDYVRYISFDYYESFFNKNPIMRIIGGGYPCCTADEYTVGNTYQSNISQAYTLKLFWVDLGLLGLSYIIGIPAVLLIVYLIFITIKKCKNKEYQYIRFTLIVVTLGSIITSMEVFRSGNFVIIGIMFYLVNQLQIEKIKK